MNCTIRLAFVESHLDDVLDSADNPLHGNRWWLTAEDPFQCLATCINLSEALKSSSPHTVISHLPIHQVSVFGCLGIIKEHLSTYAS
ncbi:hypothetical protein CsSME_00008245 [Camellia sinensis var. sinensis]